MHDPHVNWRLQECQNDFFICSDCTQLKCPHTVKWTERPSVITFTDYWCLLLFLWVRTRNSYTQCVSGGTGDESVNWVFLEAKWESLEAQNEISRGCVLGCCRIISRLVCDGLLLTPANAADGLMRTQLPDNWDSVDYMMYVIAQPCFWLSNLHHRDATLQDSTTDCFLLLFNKDSCLIIEFKLQSWSNWWARDSV